MAASGHTCLWVDKREKGEAENGRKRLRVRERERESVCVCVRVRATFVRKRSGRVWREREGLWGAWGWGGGGGFFEP